MVGTRGKGKASAAKSKRKAPSVVSSVPEPVVAVESHEGPSYGVETKIEISSTYEKENAEKKLEIPGTVTDEKENDEKKLEIPSMDTDEKENTDTNSELVVGNGLEENQQLADEGNDYENNDGEKNGVENNDGEKNDDEKDITDELNANEVDSLSGQTEEAEEVNDNDVDSENDGVDTEEENAEELSDGGGAVSNIDVEDNEGKPDEEMAAEVKEPTDDCGGDKNIHSGEENKDTEVDEDGKMVTGEEGLAASEHGVADEEMMSKGASDTLNAEEPLSTSANNEKTAEGRGNDNVSNNVEASAGVPKKPKRKLIRKRLLEKVSKNDVASVNEANDASGNAKSAETNEYERNEEKAEIKPPVTIKRKLNRKRKPIVSESNAVGAAFAEPRKNEQETEKLKVEDEKVKRSGNKASHLKKKRKQMVSNHETTNMPGPSRKGKSKKADSMGMIFMCNAETKKDCYRYKVLGLPAGKKDFVLNIYKGMTLFLFDVELKMLYGIYQAAATGGFDIEPRAFKSKFPSQVRFTVLEDCLPLAEEKFKGAIKENYYTKNKFDCTLNSVQVGKLCTLFRETTRKADSKRIVRNPVEGAPSSQRDRKKRKRTKEGHREVGPTSPSKRERRPSERNVRERRHSERNVRERRHSEREVRQRRDSEREVRQRRDSEREVRRGPAAVVDDNRYYQRRVVYDEKEAYLPPSAPPVHVVYQALPPPSLTQTSSYSYGGPARDDIYRREPVLERVPVIERRDLGLSSLTRPAEVDWREPYASYKESRPSYLEPAYEAGIRRDLHEPSVRRDPYEPSATLDLIERSASRDLYEPSMTRDTYEPSARRDPYEPSARREPYELSARRDLYEPSARRDHYDYTSNARVVEYHATEYRPPLPPYRRY